MPKILDTNRNTFGHYDALVAALGQGGTVIRYIAAGLEHEEKVIKPGEARAIAEAGLRLGLVYEIGGKPSGAAVGARDGAYALQYAPTVGAPADGSVVIWYTVDWDAGESDYPGIRDAFRAFKDALQGQFKVGGYASGYITMQLYEDRLIDAIWLTDSLGFRETRASIAAGAYTLRQGLPANIAGLDADPDVQHVENDGTDAPIGDFVPFAHEAVA